MVFLGFMRMTLDFPVVSYTTHTAVQFHIQFGNHIGIKDSHFGNVSHASFFFFFFLVFHFICFKIFIYLFIYIFGCIGSLLLCADFLQLRRAGAILCCGAWASYCGWPLVAEHELQACGLQQLWHVGSVVVAPECRLSSCGARAQLLRGMWDLPGRGLEPVSPALAGDS